MSWINKAKKGFSIS